ncbi:MAG: diguanylate cyclase [Clostridium sp.]|jgi:diguanylate cyclase (GGDEF)-like protein|nr:diguanylate cyclase [Clostridium sp.]
MGGKNVRTITITWILPLILLFVTAVIMLLRYSAVSRENARRQIEREHIAQAEDYSLYFEEIMKAALKIQTGMAGMASDLGENQTSVLESMVENLSQSGEFYLAAYCKADGTAMISGQRKQNLSELPYFDKLQQDKQGYFFVADDGITGESALVSACPVEGSAGGSLVVYYSPKKIKELMNKMGYDLNTAYFLTDTEGTVFGAYGAADSTQLADYDTLWNGWEGYMTDGITAEMIQLRLKNRMSGMFYIKSVESFKMICYAPVRIADWYWVMSVNESYVQNQINRQLKAAQDILWRLFVAVFVFLVWAGVLNIIMKVNGSRRNRDLQEKADSDLLTGLNNKVATERKIREYLQENPGSQSILFVLDIDNFKKINDTMGHAFGDEVLRTLGHRLKVEFRMSDIIGRTGGDEFMILMKNILDENILTQGKKVENFFRNFKVGEHVKYVATASIGGAVFPRDAKDFESLYQAADRALYTAKKRGKNQLAFCHEPEEGA